MNSRNELPLYDYPLNHPSKASVLELLERNEMLQIDREPIATEGRCYWNVIDHVAIHGGKLIQGWMVEWSPEVLISIMHHGVWQKEDGSLLDITKATLTQSANKTTFVPSGDIVNPNGITFIPRRYLALKDDYLLNKFIKLYQINFNAMRNFKLEMLHEKRASFFNGEFRYLQDAPAHIADKYKATIDLTHNECILVKKSIINKYFKQ
ncbi:TPA: hypothetical protein ACGD8A_001182 [Serratia marcescens]|uniref:Uncharacterized protein n=1 Tax=Serratia marcescens SM39 TaxID=1334564 RepID=A0AAT9E6B3_SERMA|nr:hypothetical protein [Serratia marcescens]BAO32618.1 hypothetical protein SM39_0556 [Serratia marcescens SM39]BCZ39824.1 hypothetical protein SMGES_11500 [Serratia marcescens]HBI6266447.1 hypothetical protein [Serratia marcescens]HBI6947664.1 hypothetical protein [Serratia marcescens]